MTGIILDASALIAMLQGEVGAKKVADAIGATRMSSVSYAEVVSHFIQAGMPQGDVDAMLNPLPIDIVPLDKQLARLAGGLQSLASAAGLSLGDRCCLALSLRDGLPAWTADRVWRSIADAAKVKVVIIG
jgi:ribonuclease VapC